MARNSSRSMTSMPSMPPRRSATPSPAITMARRRPLDDRPQPVVGEPVVHRHERLAGDGRRRTARSGTAGEFTSTSTTCSPGCGGQPRAGAPGPVAELGEGEAAVEGAEGDAVAEAVGRHLEDHADVHGRASVRRRQRLGALHDERRRRRARASPRRPWCTAARSPRRRCVALAQQGALVERRHGRAAGGRRRRSGPSAGRRSAGRPRRRPSPPRPRSRTSPNADGLRAWSPPTSVSPSGPLGRLTVGNTCGLGRHHMEEPVGARLHHHEHPGGRRPGRPGPGPRGPRLHVALDRGALAHPGLAPDALSRRRRAARRRTGG